MTPRQASAELLYLSDLIKLGRVNDALTPRLELALMIGRQALDVLATLEERLHLHEPVKIEHREIYPEGTRWTATRGHRTHLGSDLTDALGQLCQTLAME